MIVTESGQKSQFLIDSCTPRREIPEEDRTPSIRLNPTDLFAIFADTLAIDLDDPIQLTETPGLYSEGQSQRSEAFYLLRAQVKYALLRSYVSEFMTNLWIRDEGNNDYSLMYENWRAARLGEIYEDVNIEGNQFSSKEVMFLVTKFSERGEDSVELGEEIITDIARQGYSPESHIMIPNQGIAAYFRFFKDGNNPFNMQSIVCPSFIFINRNGGEINYIDMQAYYERSKIDVFAGILPELVTNLAVGEYVRCYWGNNFQHIDPELEKALRTEYKTNMPKVNVYMEVDGSNRIQYWGDSGKDRAVRINPNRVSGGELRYSIKPNYCYFVEGMNSQITEDFNPYVIAGDFLPGIVEAAIKAKERLEKDKIKKDNKKKFPLKKKPAQAEGRKELDEFDLFMAEPHLVQQELFV